MRVGKKSFVLFGLAFGLTPLTLDAAPPVANTSRVFSAVHASRAKIKGLKVACRLDTKATGGLSVHLDVHNPTRRTVTAELKVDVLSRRPSSPMARMIPMPVRHGSRILKVTLRPGARLAKKLLIKKGAMPNAKDLPRYYTFVAKAPKKRAKNLRKTMG